jgi:hypothetical protein
MHRLLIGKRPDHIPLRIHHTRVLISLAYDIDDINATWRALLNASPLALYIPPTPARDSGRADGKNITGRYRVTTTGAHRAGRDARETRRRPAPCSPGTASEPARQRRADSSPVSSTRRYAPPGTEDGGRAPREVRPVAADVYRGAGPTHRARRRRRVVLAFRAAAHATNAEAYIGSEAQVDSACWARSRESTQRAARGHPESARRQWSVGLACAETLEDGRARGRDEPAASCGACVSSFTSHHQLHVEEMRCSWARIATLRPPCSCAARAILATNVASRPVVPERNWIAAEVCYSEGPHLRTARDAPTALRG